MPRADRLFQHVQSASTRLSMERATRRQLTQSFILLLSPLLTGTQLNVRHAVAQESSHAGVAAFKKSYRSRYSGAEDVKEKILMERLMELRLTQPDLQGEQLDRELQRHLDNYDRRILQGIPESHDTYRSVFEWTTVGLEAASELIPDQYGGSVVGAVTKVTTKIGSAYADYKAQDYPYNAVVAKFDQSESVRNRDEEILDNFITICGSDDECRRAYDVHAGGELTFKLGELQDTDKALNTIADDLADANLQKFVDENGNIKTEIIDETGKLIGDLQSELDTQFAGLHGAIAESRQHLSELVVQQGDDIISYLKAEEERKRLNAVAEQRRLEEQQRQVLERQLHIEAAGSTIYLVSTLVGFQNPKLAQEISVIGNTVFSVAESINKYADTAAALGTIGSALGSVVLTGNIVGAALNVASLFGSSGPSAEELILDEVRELRQQIGDLHEEMRERFDQIDKTLNGMYDILIFNLEQLDTIDRNVEIIKSQLTEIHTELFLIGRRIVDTARIVDQRRLKESVNTAIGYEERTGSPLSQELFHRFESDFYTWAVDNSRDPVENFALERNYEDEFIAEELKAPIDVNVQYLAEWLRRKGLPSFVVSGQTLANPRTWTSSAWAYALLQLESPDYALGLTRALDVSRAGEELQTAFNTLRTRTKGADGTIQQNILGTLMTRYRTKIDELYSTLGEEENKLFATLFSNLDEKASEPLTTQLKVRYAGTDNWSPKVSPPKTLPALVSTWLQRRASLSLGRGGPLINERSFFADLQDGPMLSVEMVQGWEGPRLIHQSHTFHIDPCKPLGTSCSIPVTYTENSKEFHPYVSVRVYYQDARDAERIPILAGSVSLEEDFVRECTVHNPRTDWCPKNAVRRFRANPQWFEQNWDRYKAAFEAMTADDWESDFRRTFMFGANDERLARLRAVNAADAAVNKAVNLAVIEEMEKQLKDKTSNAYKATARVTGMKALITLACSLGLPRAVSSSDMLASLLWGSQALLDEFDVPSFYRNAVTMIDQGENPQTKTPIREEAARRIEALMQVISEYQDALEAGTIDESHPLIASVLHLLACARNVAEA